MERVAVLKPLLAVRKNLTRILRSFVKDCYILLRLSLNNEKACCDCFKSLFCWEKNTHEIIQLLCYADIILQFIQCVWAGFPIPVAQTVKNPTAMQETRVQSLGREDPLEKAMAGHSSILAWRIPWTEEPVRLQSLGLQRVGHNWVTNTHEQVYIKETHCND